MKYIITESRLESAMISYLNDGLIPDDGWSYPDVYQKDVKRYGDVNFFINDKDSYSYYGCNHLSFEEDGHLHNYECPLLLIHSKVSQELSSWFGDMWKPIFKKWFEENTGLIVNQIKDDYI
jgi:hypothetical protein